ncbi:MAG TPA: HlyD family efflux transporter periplasmic adaptor subunit [Fimbriimonas sp.]
MKKIVIPIIIALVFVGAFAYRAVLKGKAAGALKPSSTTKVAKGDLVLTVVDTGTIDASKAVEVKSRVSGRLAKLFVDEGDFVSQGQLIGVIDPQETELMVRQNAAQLRGAQSAVQRASLEIGQRRTTAQAAYDQARVRLAQLILERDTQPTLTSAAIQSAQTSLATAQQEKGRLLQSAHPEQLNQAESAVKEAQANEENAEREYRRQADLESRGYVASRAVESAKLNLDLARVRLNSAKESLSKLASQQKSELAKAEEAIRQAQSDLTRARANRMQDQVKAQEVASARAEVAKAKAALQDPAIMAKQREQSLATVDQLGSVLSDAERQLRETQVRAPIGGVVTKKMLEVGELATGLSGFSAGTPILRIEDRRSMRVKLDINEIDVAKLQLGQTARVEVDALPNVPMEGTVVKISPASNQSAAGQPTGDAVVRYQVEVLLDRPSPQLRSGMSAKCSMDVVKRNNVVVLPIEFASKNGNRYTVEVVSGSGKAAKTAKREIKVGVATGAKLEVLEGLGAGEIVQKPKYTGPERKGMMSGPGDEH